MEYMTKDTFIAKTFSDSGRKLVINKVGEMSENHSALDKESLSHLCLMTARKRKKKGKWDRKV